jgi:predicted GTPase
VVINKEDTASWQDIEAVRQNVLRVNPRARIVDAASPIFVEEPEVVRGRRVLVVEDGPTLTHGEMGYGAGTVAARRFGASELVDPRPYLVGTLRDTFAAYPHLGRVLPAMGYGAQQIRELEETIAAVPADAVVIATPVDLRRLIKIEKPSTRVYYELQEIGRPTLEEILEPILQRLVHP